MTSENVTVEEKAERAEELRREARLLLTARDAMDNLCTWAHTPPCEPEVKDRARAALCEIVAGLRIVANLSHRNGIGREVEVEAGAGKESGE